MNDRVPCSASAAELAHDRAHPPLSDHRLEVALDDVLERVLNGERVPYHGSPSIDRVGFLEEQADLQELVAPILSRNAEVRRHAVEQFERIIEARLRVHLEDHEVVRAYAAEMASAPVEEG
jgi:hypothetical protein